MEINEFAKINFERSVKHAGKFDWEYFAIAMGGETGEILNILKKIKRGDPGFDKKDVIDETVDVITYAFLLLRTLDVDVEKAIMHKYEKVNKRLEAGGFHKR